MDRELSELSRAGLSAYDEAVSPAYDQIRADLVGLLAMNGRFVGDLQAEAENSRNNLEVVRSFTAELPQAEPVELTRFKNSTITYERPRIHVADAYRARFVQSNLIWDKTRTGDPIDTGFLLPYYLIGAHQSSEEGDRTAHSSLLLAPAFSDADKSDSDKESSKITPPLVVVGTWSKEIEALREVQRRKLATEYSKAQLVDMFDVATGSLVVKSGTETPGSIMTERMISFTGKYPRSRNKANQESIQANISGTDYVGTSRSERLIPDGISDQIFAKYNVLDFLNRLASASGTVQQLDQTLEKYVVDAKSSTDQLLED